MPARGLRAVPRSVHARYDAGCHAIDILIVNLRAELPPFYASMGFVPDGTTPFEDPRR
jgi:hypothetical protein